MQHVLVVDDEPAICQLMQMVLEADGSCRVTRTSTPQEAIGVLGYDKPDAAIVDAVLPMTSGLRLAKDIAERGVPVLLMTGAPEMAAKLDRIGCHFLSKPFRMGDLRDEVRELLNDGTDRRIELGLALHLLAS